MKVQSKGHMEALSCKKLHVPQDDVLGVELNRVPISRTITLKNCYNVPKIWDFDQVSDRNPRVNK